MTVDVRHGDCREVLRTLEPESVHCVVTSPPYFGLRDYGTAQWEGGDDGCDHSPERRGSRFATPVSSKQASNAGSGTASRRDCSCGAVRIDRQIGLEPTPDEYIAELVAVFAEVRRVLRKDGTVWLNLGDSYARAGGEQGGGNRELLHMDGKQRRMTTLAAGCKPKDLLMIPARVAIALQADGWWLRSDIIWSKPNPMPESVTDRPTSAHEHVFLLAKAERYFFDADAVREPQTNGSQEDVTARAGLNAKYQESNQKANHLATQTWNPLGRNIRNVWTIATSPYPEAHFATFPPELAERCIKAGTSERGCCSACGAPWVRQTDAKFIPQGDVSADRGVRGAPGQKPMDASNSWEGFPRGTTQRQTLGWEASCACAAPVKPCTVLDHFGGAGTVGLVADRLQRNAILIELNAEYVAMSEQRIRNDAPLFAGAAQ